MDKAEFLYRLKYLVWQPLLVVEGEDHKITVRAEIDAGGKIYPRGKPIQFDVVIDGVVGPNARTLEQLNKIMERNFHGPILRLWRKAYERLYLLVI